VGDIVYVSGPPVGGVVQVAQADATDSGKRPPVGVIVSKLNGTEGTIQSEGISDAVFAGLTVSASYYLGTDGQLVTTPPSGHPAQVIGVAVSTTQLFLNIAQVEPSSGGMGGGGGGHSAWTEDEFSPTPAQVTFILSQAPTDSESIVFVVNGVIADDVVDYTVSGQTVTWLNTNFVMEAGDVVAIRYQ
jgi:hypothetical protein